MVDNNKKQFLEQWLIKTTKKNNPKFTLFLMTMGEKFNKLKFVS